MLSQNTHQKYTTMYNTIISVIQGERIIHSKRITFVKYIPTLPIRISDNERITSSILVMLLNEVENVINLIERLRIVLYLNPKRHIKREYNI